MSVRIPTPPHHPPHLGGRSHRRLVDACERNGGVLLVVAAGSFVSLVAVVARLLVPAG